MGEFLILHFFGLCAAVPIVIRLPFIHWVYKRHLAHVYANWGYYYVITNKGQGIVCVVKQHRGNDHMIYRVYSKFKLDYTTTLSLHDHLEWTSKDDLVEW